MVCACAVGGRGNPSFFYVVTFLTLVVMDRRKGATYATNSFNKCSRHHPKKHRRSGRRQIRDRSIAGVIRIRTLLPPAYRQNKNPAITKKFRVPRQRQPRHHLQLSGTKTAKQFPTRLTLKVMQITSIAIVLINNSCWKIFPLLRPERMQVRRGWYNHVVETMNL